MLFIIRREKCFLKKSARAEKIFFSAESAENQLKLKKSFFMRRFFFSFRRISLNSAEIYFFFRRKILCSPVYNQKFKKIYVKFFYKKTNSAEKKYLPPNKKYLPPTKKFAPILSKNWSAEKKTAPMNTKNLSAGKVTSADCPEIPNSFSITI